MNPGTPGELLLRLWVLPLPFWAVCRLSGLVLLRPSVEVNLPLVEASVLPRPSVAVVYLLPVFPREEVAAGCHPASAEEVVAAEVVVEEVVAVVSVEENLLRP